MPALQVKLHDAGCALFFVSTLDILLDYMISIVIVIILVFEFLINGGGNIGEIHKLHRHMATRLALYFWSRARLRNGCGSRSRGHLQSVYMLDKRRWQIIMLVCTRSRIGIRGAFDLRLGIRRRSHLLHFFFVFRVFDGERGRLGLGVGARDVLCWQSAMMMMLMWSVRFVAVAVMAMLIVDLCTAPRAVIVGRTQILRIVLDELG